MTYQKKIERCTTTRSASKKALKMADPWAALRNLALPLDYPWENTVLRATIYELRANVARSQHY